MSATSCDTVAATDDADHNGVGLNCTPDQHVRPTAAYAVPADAPVDTYVCYGFDVQNTAKRQITAVAPALDNQKILHHILVFEAPDSYSTVPKVCNMTDAAPWKMVAGWAMGGKSIVYPPEAGLPQLHDALRRAVALQFEPASSSSGRIAGSDIEGLLSRYPADSRDRVYSPDVTLFAFLGQVRRLTRPLDLSSAAVSFRWLLSCYRRLQPIISWLAIGGPASKNYKGSPRHVFGTQLVQSKALRAVPAGQFDALTLAASRLTTTVAAKALSLLSSSSLSLFMPLV